MLGAIAGDVIGSVFERANVKHKRFALFGAGSRFTDDTVLTVAIADALLRDADLAATLRDYHRRYPDAGYGPSFRRWLEAPPGTPLDSASNGAAMRISPVGHAFATLDDTLAQAARCTVLTHGHAEAIAGAQATAAAVFLARHGESKAAIRRFVEARFGYDLSFTLDAIRPGFGFELSCAGTVPPALVAFLESHDFEDAVRNAISLGGDSDTLACIAGAVAEAHYGGVPEPIVAATMARLDPALIDVARRFCRRHRLADLGDTTMDMPRLPSFAEFERDALADGADEVLVREWAPNQVVATHTHPFDAEAIVVAGEMWLTSGDETLHLQPGGTFSLAAGTPHDERYGPQGATYWVARRRAR